MGRRKTPGELLEDELAGARAAELAAAYRSPDDSCPTPVIGLGQKDLVKLFTETAERLDELDAELASEHYLGVRKGLGRAAADRRRSRKAAELAGKCRDLAGRVASWSDRTSSAAIAGEKDVICSRWLKLVPEIARAEGHGDRR